MPGICIDSYIALGYLFILIMCKCISPWYSKLMFPFRDMISPCCARIFVNLD